MIYIILGLAGAAAESIHLTFEFINAHKVQQKYCYTETFKKREIWKAGINANRKVVGAETKMLSLLNGHIRIATFIWFNQPHIVNSILGNFTILYCWIPSLQIDEKFAFYQTNPVKQFTRMLNWSAFVVELKKKCFYFYFSEGVQSKSEKVAISFDSFAMGWLR